MLTLRRVTRFATGSVFSGSLVGIVLYMRMLQSADVSPLAFHFLFIAATTAMLILVLSDLSVSTKLIMIISWTVTLQLVTPLRLPGDVISNYPDALYMYQIVKNVLASGRYSFGHGVELALDYSFYPTMQVLGAVLILVTNINPIALMRFFPQLLVAPFIALAFCTFRKFTLSDDHAVAATAITASCFWMIYFLSRFVQSVVGAFFSLMLLFTLTRKSPAWTGVFIVSAVGVASAHLLSSLYVLVFFISAEIYSIVAKTIWKRATILQLTQSRLALLMIVILAWAVYPAIFETGVLVGIIQEALYGPFGLMRLSILTRAQPNPLFIRLLGDVGIVLYASLLTIGFIYLHKKNISHPCSRLLPYAFGAAVLFMIHMLAFSVGLPIQQISDLLSRGFFYPYLVGSPIAVFVLDKLLMRMNSVRATHSEPSRELHKIPRASVGKRALGFVVIALILLASMYYYYAPSRYDNSAPMNYEDARLPLEEWKTIGIWSSSHVQVNYLYGDKLVFDFVGGMGEKEVYIFPSEGRLIDWMHALSAGDLIVVRLSLATVPYEEFQTGRSDITLVLTRNNVVYNAGDPIIVILKQDGG